jgi:L-fuconolactonase
MKNLRIDSHQHFWKYDSAKHSWMNEEMGILKTDFLPVHLVPLLQICNINGCVAVQASQTEEENEFLLNLASTNDCIKGIVGWVDLRAKNLEERLEYYQQFSKIKGFRHIIHDEPALDFMLQPAFLRGVSALKKFDFTYDILIFAAHLPNTIAFIKALPQQAFVIDHLAKPLIKKQIIGDWQKYMTAIASYKNVFCKISGMVTEADWKNWKKDDFNNYLDAAVETFGIDRIMYGSDWPVCTLAAQYKEQFDIVKDYFLSFSEAEQAQVFGGNATKFYKL